MTGKAPYKSGANLSLTMPGGIQERRRKFYGWGYEGDEVSPQEIAEFEKALDAPARGHRFQDRVSFA